MKYISKLLPVLALIMLATAVSSCKHLKKTDEKIVGLWTTEDKIDGVDATEYFQFNDDGTFTRLCDVHIPETPGYTVEGKWEVSLLKGGLKLTYDLSSLKPFYPWDGEPDSEAQRSILRIAKDDISESAGKGLIATEFNGSGDEMTLTFPGLGAKKFTKDTATDLVALAKLKSPKATDMDQIESEPAPAPAPVPATASSLFKDGLNVLEGTFRFRGEDYGFKVTFNYDAATGKASNPKYQANGYGSVYSLSTITISKDERSLRLSGMASGTNTSIQVEYAGKSSFEGRMTRGANSGTCRLRIR